MRFVFFSGIILLLLNSCVTQINMTTINVRNPAIITFPPEVVNIAIVDNSPSLKQNTGGQDESSTKTANSILPGDSARELLLGSMVKFMNEEAYFNNVKRHADRTNDRHEEEVIPLSKRKIQSICIENDADALISLDLFTNSVQIETEDIGYFSNYSILATKLGLLIRVYSNTGEQYGNPIVFMDSLFREETVNWSKVRENIPEINNLIAEISVLGADKLTAKFIPSWQNQERWYYSDNSSEMKKVNNLVKLDKWKEVADIWNALYLREKSTKKKTRLAFNIALANEYLDNVDEATKWIDTAYTLLPPNSKSDLALQVLKYKEILRKRTDSMTTLHKQLGMEEETDDKEKE